jgi:hypothetical protein
VQIPALDLHFCSEVGFVQDTMACGYRRSGQSRTLGRVRVNVVPGDGFTPLHVLTILSETVKESIEISPRRDQRAVVRRDTRSEKLSGGLV